MSWRKIEPEQRLRAGVRPLDAIRAYRAPPCRRESLPRRFGSARSCARGRARGRDGARAPVERRECGTPRARAFGHRRVDDAAAQRVEAIEIDDVKDENRAPAEREQPERPRRRRRTPRAARDSEARRRRRDACRSSGLGRRMMKLSSARRGEPIAAAAHGLDEAGPGRTARARGEADGCARRPCAPRCRRDRPRPGRAAARANARARDAPAGSAAGGIRSARAAPGCPLAVTRCVAGSSLSRPRPAAPARLPAHAGATPP